MDERDRPAQVIAELNIEQEERIRKIFRQVLRESEKRIFILLTPTNDLKVQRIKDLMIEGYERPAAVKAVDKER